METNCVVTECGHCFHTSCLMKNAAHNGFGCPYCRAVLADVPDEELEDDEDSYLEDDEDELYSDQSLRGLRWLFQRAQNEPLDEEDEEEEEEDEEEEEPEVVKPSAEFIAQKLAAQGVTMADLVKCLLSINHEEYEDDEECEQKEDDLFGKFRIIISNYNPTQEQQQHPVEPQPQDKPEPTSIQILTTTTMVVDDAAQPKERNHRINNVTMRSNRIINN